MFTIVHPCPRCGSIRIGWQFMNAEVGQMTYMGSRPACLCGWRGTVLAPNLPPGSSYTPTGEPTFPVQWEEQAKRLAKAARGLIRRGYVEVGAELTLKGALADYDQHLANSNLEIPDVAPAPSPTHADETWKKVATDLADRLRGINAVIDQNQYSPFPTHAVVGIRQRVWEALEMFTAWDSNGASTEEVMPNEPLPDAWDGGSPRDVTSAPEGQPEVSDLEGASGAAHTAGVDLSRPCVVCGAALSFHTKTDARRCLWTLVKPELQENDGEYDFSKGRAERLAPDAGADGRHIHNGQFWWRDGTCPVPGCPPEMNRPGHETAVLCECDDWDENPADPTSCKTCGHDVSYHEERGRDDSQEAPCWHPKAYPDVSAEREDERYFRLRDRIVDVMREQAAYDITPLELATHIAAALAGDVPAPGASPDPFSRPCPHSVRQAAIAIAKYTELKTPHNIDMQTLAHQVLKWASDVIEPASREDS